MNQTILETVCHVLWVNQGRLAIGPALAAGVDFTA